MKKIVTILLLSGFTYSMYGQAAPKKIKIMLLGTFHFNQSPDSSSKLHFNLFTGKRQKEIDNVVSQLVKQKPGKILLEFTEKDQRYYDSIYTDYLNGKEPQRLKTKANEIFQPGMKTAKKLGLKNVTGINYQPQELSDTTCQPVNSVDKAIRDVWVALENLNDTTPGQMQHFTICHTPINYQNKILCYKNLL